ncbi:MAG: calcium/sodium antiporter [Lachnospiraceae bacterium]|nr:calcium/sodium antiporter [Lachnospiraceae bacterium]
MTLSAIAPYFLLVLGFLFLIKGADLFVDGSSSIAKHMKIPSVIVGLTIVAMGTSAPEASVSITAAIAGNSDISLGNIVGSNIFNFLVVIGVSAIIFPVVSHKDIINRDLWWNLGITGVLLILMLDNKIGRIDGVILLIGMATYLFFVIRNALKNRTTEDTEKLLSVPKSIIFMIIGLAAIICGGNFVVENASIIAASLGLSETLIGLTIVAIGTSLPELVTSVTAAKKQETGIALGNAVGSNIFNILFILGASSVLTPINVASELFIDTIILIAVSIIIFIFARTKKITSRPEGIVCVLLYVAYTAYIIIR